ncbi:MAG TPA: hypothetical protein VLH56_19495 [Dissulfurispiraceae bacterium]|nr:hypothetical protein [Dissulfurispiraceae bacterium]
MINVDGKDYVRPSDIAKLLGVDPAVISTDFRRGILASTDIMQPQKMIPLAEFIRYVRMRAEKYAKLGQTERVESIARDLLKDYGVTL